MRQMKGKRGSKIRGGMRAVPAADRDGAGLECLGCLEGEAAGATGALVRGRMLMRGADT
jgi:hypothetical protein